MEQWENLGAGLSAGQRQAGIHGGAANDTAVAPKKK